MSEPVVVLSTCGDETVGQRIASALVEERLAACVNVVPHIQSTFCWKGEVQIDSEALLIIKTVTDHIAAIEARIKELSGYEVPEVIALSITTGSTAYLNWLFDQVRHTDKPNIA